MKITDKSASIRCNKNFISSSGQVTGFQKKYYFKKENSDSVNISEDAIRMFREQNTSLLVKTLSKILQGQVELAGVSEQSWDEKRHREVEKLSDRIKTGQYDFENSEILGIAGSRIFELL